MLKFDESYEVKDRGSGLEDRNAGDSAFAKAPAFISRFQIEIREGATEVVELVGIEPTTSALQRRRSPS